MNYSAVSSVESPEILLSSTFVVQLAQGEAPTRGPKGDDQRAKSVPVNDERIETESPPAGAQTAHPATIVLSFVMCALVMFAAIG